MRYWRWRNTFAAFICATAILCAHPAMAANILSQNSYMWSIPAGKVSIPNGYCITGGTLRVHSPLVTNSFFPHLDICILADKKDGFFELVYPNNVAGNYFLPHCLCIFTVYPNDLYTNVIDIPLNYFITFYPSPKLSDFMNFKLSDSTAIELSPVLLNLMDYFGSGQSATFGFNTYDMTFAALTLELTCQAYVGRPGKFTITQKWGNFNPPVFQQLQDMTFLSGTDINFPIFANDPDNDTLTYSVVNLPDGALFVGNTFYWKPTRKDVGVLHLVFSVFDGRYSNTMTVNLTIQDNDHAPEFVSLNDAVGQERKVLTFMVEAEDPDLDPISITANNLPYGAVFQSNRFYWSPIAGQAGNYEIIFKVSDGTLQTQQKMLIKILPSQPSGRKIFIF